MILSHRKHLLPLLAAWALSGAVQAQQVAPQDKDRAWLESKGTLLFEDDFEREETGNGLKDIGKGWESATADRAPHIKQADLDQGILKIYSNEKAAGHGIHIHHDAGFTDGGTTLRFRLPGLNKGESCIVGHVDRELKSVHAGHLCYAYLNPTNIMLRDSKTGIHDLKVQARRAEFLKRKEKLPPDLDAFLQTKQKVVSWKADNEWHELTLVFEGDEMRLSVDGKVLVTHRSEGFAHPMKRWLSFGATSTLWIDDVKVWKVK
ncbi:hypothetical protein [Verrucomicrobium spinosum]|uniref:hypothetical protein n=1 Tax=Verrucomicrobium spinosum TaxID=2736 RepID=UPI0012F6A434|nr:hypothetical protein [Verrucomicrobium spinosum]